MIVTMAIRWAEFIARGGLIPETKMVTISATEKRMTVSRLVRISEKNPNMRASSLSVSQGSILGDPSAEDVGEESGPTERIAT